MGSPALTPITRAVGVYPNLGMDLLVPRLHNGSALRTRPPTFPALPAKLVIGGALALDRVREGRGQMAASSRFVRLLPAYQLGVLTSTWSWRLVWVSRLSDGHRRTFLTRLVVNASLSRRSLRFIRFVGIYGGSGSVL